MSKIVIIIPTYNRHKRISELLECLMCINKANFIIQIVIVNDGSTDGTNDLLRSYEQFITIVNGDGNWWYTKCINQGISRGLELSPDYFLLLNDDILIKNDFFIKLYNQLQQIPEKSILGFLVLTVSAPQTIVFSGVKNINKYISRYSYYFLHSTPVNDLMLSGLKYTEELTGRGMLFSIGVFNELGYFDENFTQYGSDTDYSWRARSINIPLFISWDSIIYAYEKETGDGSKYLNPSRWQYIRSIFNEKSPNSLTMKRYFIHKHFSLFKGILNLFILFLSTIKSVYKK